MGDLATHNDAARLARSQALVKQITTETVCHLDATMVDAALEDWNRVVLLSVTEGEDKPLKYPTIFNTADLAVITKLDLAEAVEFDLATANQSIQSVRPGMQVIQVSAKTGAGMDRWLEELYTLRRNR